MNHFDCGAQRVRTGWLAFYRRVHQTENFILRDGRHDIVFASEVEAKEAARVAFLAYLNSPISGLTAPAEMAINKADAMFNLAPSGLSDFQGWKLSRADLLSNPTPRLTG